MYEVRGTMYDVLVRARCAVDAERMRSRTNPIDDLPLTIDDSLVRRPKTCTMYEVRGTI